MMRIFSGFFVWFLLLALLMTVSVVHAASAESLNCSALDELPDYAWQKTASFPEPPGGLS